MESPIENTSEKKYCLHINGTIAKLDKDTIHNSFKLTQSSYISADTFNNSVWKRRFTDDLEIASVIIFIGYSLYDIEIEKILHEIDKIKEKVFFIQAENEPDEMNDYKYEKYGKILRIGAEKLASKLQEFKNNSDINKLGEEFYLDCFEECNIKNEDSKIIRESEIENFLMFGKIDEQFLQKETLFPKNEPPFLVVREDKIQKAISLLKENQYIVILSDIGNGKTIFLKQLAIKLSLEFKVYELKYRGDISMYKKDIDKIAQQKDISYIILDSYLRYLDLVEFIFLQKYKNIKIILSARTMDHYQYIRSEDKLPRIVELNIDKLEEKEVENFCKILDNIGIWMDWSMQRKQDYIKDKCFSQILYILIEFLKAKQIANKMKDELESILKDDVKKKHIFVILLLNIMDISIGIGLLEELLGEYDLSIFKDDDRSNHIFQYNLFDRDNEIQPKSSIFSRFILQSGIFESQYMIAESLCLLKNIEKQRQERKSFSQYINEIRINLFRFNFIERMLPDNNKKSMLIKYYEYIKTYIPKMQNDPQYYLQYAMCHIANKDFDKAQRNLDNAYVKAQNTNYDTFKIDNQQARLYLLKAALHQTNIKEAIGLFLKADDFITKRHKNDIYKYKVMQKYKDFIDNRSSSFNPEAKEQILACCKRQLDSMNGAKGFEENIKQQKIYIDCKVILENIIVTLSH